MKRALEKHKDASHTAWIAIFIVVGAYFLDGIFTVAQAVAPAVDASCTNLENFGFTTGLVWCIEASIGKAVAIYVAAMQTNLAFFEGMAFMLALALYGIKLFQQSMKEPMKETMMFLFRVIIGVLLFYQAQRIYPIIAGPSGIINETIGWVMNTSGPGSGASHMFNNLVSAKCTSTGPLPPLPAPAASFQGYQVWQAFDCMFSKLFGAANPTNHPTAFATSMLLVIGAALTSGTLGATVAFIGVSAFLTIIFMVFRALFLVLLSYISIGFLALFTPLVAPLMFFESKYIQEKVKKWLSLMVSVMFQPVFVIGFLAMAVTVDDALIEGTLPAGATGCHMPTYPNASSTRAAAPPKGYGQDGTGVCSFTQLFYGAMSAPNIIDFFRDMMEQNKTIANISAGGGLQGHAPNRNVGTPTAWYDPAYDLQTAKTDTVNPAYHVAATSGTVQVSGVTTLKNYVPLKQMMLTLFTFIFATFAMMKLLEVIPEMASNMTLGTGLNLMSQLQVPFEGAINGLANSLEKVVKRNVGPGSILNGRWGKNAPAAAPTRTVSRPSTQKVT